MLLLQYFLLFASSFLFFLIGYSVMSINKSEYQILNKLYKTKKSINIKESDSLDSLIKRNFVYAEGTKGKFILGEAGKGALEEYLANKSSYYLNIYNSILSISAPLKPFNRN